jgi:hypothetical protein
MSAMLSTDLSFQTFLHFFLQKIDHPLQLALAKFIATEGREMSVEMLEETTTLLQLAMNTCIKTKVRSCQ